MPASHTAPFPILSLPADIRLKIYEQCLGGRTIHIGWTNSIDRRRVCQATLSEEELYAKCLAVEQPLYLVDEANTVWSRHSFYGPCGHGHISDVLHLNLLLSCKQIYHEAWKTTWRANLFFFHGRGSINDFFVDFLTARQKNAIQQIRILENFYPQFNWNAWRHWSDPEGAKLHSIASELVDLRKLDIHLECAAWRLKTQEPGNYNSAHERQEACLAWVMAFATCPKLTKVKVMILGRLRSQDDKLISTSDLIARGKELKDWSERTEARIWQAAKTTREHLKLKAEG